MIFLQRRGIVYTPINYGGLYNRHAIVDGRNIAPAGWHVLTKTEFETLITTLSGGSEAGNHLKEIGNAHWNDQNEGVDNSSGFTARGSGYRGNAGSFSAINIDCLIWTSTAYAPTIGYYLALNYNGAYASMSANYDFYGCCLRLIKDDSTDPGFMTGNDGKVYPTVKIGDQVLMACNSAETKYRNGDSIPEVTDNGDWAALTTGARCAYDNDWGNV